MFTAFMLLTLTNINSQIQPRDVLAVPGTFSSSYDWHPEINLMRNSDGYLIRDVFSPSLFDWNATISGNVSNLNNMVDHPNHNYANVLGLGHDVGGLALRGLKQVNPKVTGLILVGTPNRGSNLLRDLQSPPGVNSNFEDWLKTLDAWKGGVECKDCDKTKKLIEFVKAFKAEKYGEGAINDANAYYNSLPAPDPNSTAIIWGNAGNQTIGTFLGSMDGINPASFIDLEECARRVKAIKEAKIKEKKWDQKLDRVVGFFTLFTNFFSLNLKDPKLGVDGLITKVAKFITDGIKLVLDDIKNSKALSQEEKDLFICDFANQRLEAEWKLRIIGGTTKVITTYVNGPQYDPQKCQLYQPMSQWNTSHPNHASYCYYASLYCTNTVLTFVTEPTDLVFTKTEQTHPSVTNNWELRNTNHFQEQAYNNNKSALQYIFVGNQYTRVPKG